MLRSGRKALRADHSAAPFERLTRLRVWIGLLALLIAGLMMINGSGRGLDESLAQARNRLRHHAADGNLVLVEIDARSIARYSAWPWPRGLYARAIGAADRAGAAMMAFDIDLSARSTAAEDSALSQAIARSRMPVVLPTFVQSATQGSRTLVENLPLPEFREHAMLASVNIAADSDGLVRKSPVTVVTNGVPRPSISVILAGRTVKDITSFPLDGAIALESLPRISFADLIEGRVPPGRLRGKNLLVGATAIELGDRYGVPGYGVMPGAIVQLLAAETLQEGSAPIPVPDLIALLPLLVLVRRQQVRAGPGWRFVIAGLLLLLLPLVLETVHFGTAQIAPGLSALLLIALGDALLAGIARIRQGRLIDGDTGLGNAAALRQLVSGNPRGAVVAMRMANYDELSRMLGPVLVADFWAALLRRMGAVSEQVIHRIGPDSVGWHDSASPTGEIFEHLESAAMLISQPLRIGNHAVRVVAGFGLALIEADPARSLDNALAAAARACRQGERCIQHELADDHVADLRLILAGDIEAALINGQISVVYQPKLDLSAGTITGCEALLRWQHPKLGAISPELIVAIAEEHECIVALTRFVFDSAIVTQKRWQQKGLAIGVAVNMSPVLMRDIGFLTGLADTIRELRVTPGSITLEVTEIANLVVSEEAAAALRVLVDAGARLSIDDYGTGQSTLSYLKRLPARELKIDKSFVLGMVSDAKDRLMVRSTIKLAHDLGYAVVAEGVETEAILNELVEAGCDYAQGWFIGHPVSAELFTETLLSASMEPAATRYVRA